MHSDELVKARPLPTNLNARQNAIRSKHLYKPDQLLFREPPSEFFSGNGRSDYRLQRSAWREGPPAVSESFGTPLSCSFQEKKGTDRKTKNQIRLSEKQSVL